jgi:hypothetical protein
MIPAVTMRETANAATASGCTLLGNDHAAVGGTVIHQKQLPSVICLRDHAVESFQKEALLITEDNDYRHAG